MFSNSSKRSDSPVEGPRNPVVRHKKANLGAQLPSVERLDAGVGHWKCGKSIIEQRGEGKESRRNVGERKYQGYRTLFGGALIFFSPRGRWLSAPEH